MACSDTLQFHYLYWYAAEFSYRTDITHSFSVDDSVSIYKPSKNLQRGDKRGVNNIAPKIFAVFDESFCTVEKATCFLFVSMIILDSVMMHSR